MVEPFQTCVCHFGQNLNYFSVNTLWISIGAGDEQRIVLYWSQRNYALLLRGGVVNHLQCCVNCSEVGGCNHHPGASRGRCPLCWQIYSLSVIDLGF